MWRSSTHIHAITTCEQGDVIKTQVMVVAIEPVPTSPFAVHCETVTRQSYMHMFRISM